MEYQQAWTFQELLLKRNVEIKSRDRTFQLQAVGRENNNDKTTGSHVTATAQDFPLRSTTNYFLFVEHPPVYTLGKSGQMKNLLIDEEERASRGIQFFQTNRGGDITFHGPGQVVGYPILDLENFFTDIGRYLRSIEEVIILTLAEYGIAGRRSAGETGVWIDPDIPGMERKICAIGVRCSRWITMHGFALNVNTDLDYFNFIVPCGIQNKQVTSLRHELGKEVSLGEVKDKIKRHFENVFQVSMVEEDRC
jgi:lipoyl(octanoyl) transferase